MKAGGRLHEHRTAGRLCIRTLSGEIYIHVEAGIVEMPAGMLLTLEHDDPDDVEAGQGSTLAEFLRRESTPDHLKPHERGLPIRISQVLKISRSTRYSSLSLQEVVCLCAEARDDDAWDEFVSRVGRPISLTILRTASLWGEPSPSLVEDLAQITYLKLWEGGCRLLRNFAMQHPEAILGYIKRTAVNATHDHFKHDRNRSSGGDNPHVSTSDLDPEAGGGAEGSEGKIAFGVLLDEIDDHLKRSLVGSDQERDRMIFWLYFRQGMTTQEIAALPAIGLSPKGVGSVIERVKHCIREQVLGMPADAVGEESNAKRKSSRNVVIDLIALSEHGTSLG